MGDPLSVVILVAAGKATDPATIAIERAAGEALGRGARVYVREAVAAPTDGEAIAIEEESPQTAVAEVTWGDAGHRAALLRVHVRGEPRWLDRTIGFGPADVDPERGRTIGFALASMLPDTRAAGEPSPEPAANTPPPVVVPIAPSPAPDLAEEPQRTTSRYALDVLGVGAASFGADMATAGGGAAFDARLVPWVSVRVGGAVRAGKVVSAQARALELLAWAGVALHPWPSSPSRFFTASLRADYVLMNQMLTHYSATGADLSTRARALSGVDVLVEGEWRLGEAADILTGAGVEDRLATTHVDLDGTRVATVPPLSGVAEAGVRLRF